jgi:hypothetical protein
VVRGLMGSTRRQSTGGQSGVGQWGVGASASSREQAECALEAVRRAHAINRRALRRMRWHSGGGSGCSASLNAANTATLLFPPEAVAVASSKGGGGGGEAAGSAGYAEGSVGCWAVGCTVLHTPTGRRGVVAAVSLPDRTARLRWSVHAAEGAGAGAGPWLGWEECELVGEAAPATGGGRDGEERAPPVIKVDPG